MDEEARKWLEPLRRAITALPDEGTAGQPHFTAVYEETLTATLHGTTYYIPDGLFRSVEDEFTHNEQGRWLAEYEYVVRQPAVEMAVKVHKLAPLHIRDKGRNGWRLADFARLPDAQRAHLTLNEVAALRLYTSSWFVTVNTALRTRNAATVREWATVISVLTSAIIKLSELSLPDTVVYRSYPAHMPSFLGTTVQETLVEHAFGSCSSDPTYVAAYNGHKHTEGAFLVVQPTFGSRAADITSFSQYPEQSEHIFPPGTAMRLVHQERLGAKLLSLVQPQICAMRHHTNRLLYPWSSPADPLTPLEYEMTLASAAPPEADALAADPTSGGPNNGGPNKRARTVPSNGKFASMLPEMITGEPKLAALGLEDYMGLSPEQALRRSGCSTRKAALVAEFEASGDAQLQEWLRYVLHGTAERATLDWGERDAGHEGMRLEDFHACEQAKSARLELEHVLALRLYTCTPVALVLNAPLRAFARHAETGALLRPISMAQAHPFPVTIFLIHEAIRRLRDATGDQTVTLWRGMKNVGVAADFVRAGGVEMAPMSCSYSLETALFYSQSPHSLILKMVTKSFMERGADVEWLSAFPREKECLVCTATRRACTPPAPR